MSLRERILATLAAHDGALCVLALHAALVDDMGKPTITRVRASIGRMAARDMVVISRRRAIADYGALVTLMPACQAELADGSTGRRPLAALQTP